MPVQIVPTYEHGDVRHDFAVDNEAEVAAAMERFNDLVHNQKRTAVALGKDGGQSRVVRKFDPTVESTIFLTPLKGG
jgi:hypothetical protein